MECNINCCVYERKKIRMGKLKVFCLPYAGGSKSIFQDWIHRYASVAEIVPMEYSGHGSRFCDVLYETADEVADDIFEHIIAMQPQNYMIYGHSMGCLVALLVAIRLEQKYTYAPKAVIIGGTRPPHLKGKDEKLADLPKQKFMQKIFDMGQTNAEIMNEPELVDLLYDVFHADILVDETYSQYDSLPKMKSPLVVMTGLQDEEAPADDMKEWAQYTEGDFYFQLFNADHFFPFHCSAFQDYFVNTINEIKNS